MSGHSKWNNIKRTKEKTDAQKGKIFTKIGREIAVIVKAGGADPETNSKLKDAIAKAKQSNMPNDTILRSIKKASGELGNINYEEITYEGYGVGGSAVIVKCLTDNKNRTAADIRHLFDKYGGSLGSTNCVSFMFDNKGQIFVMREEGLDEDALMMTALDLGATDVVEDVDCLIVVTDPNDTVKIKEGLEKEGFKVDSFESGLVPQNYVVLDEQKLKTFQTMLDKMDDLDDVQEVFHNVDMPEVEFED